MPDYCGRCGSPFEVDLDYGEARADELFEGGVTDLWKYQALYPLTSHQYGFELRLGSMSVVAISKARTTPLGPTTAGQPGWLLSGSASPDRRRKGSA
jgi:hypothetical protein